MQSSFELIKISPHESNKVRTDNAHAIKQNDLRRVISMIELEEIPITFQAANMTDNKRQELLARLSSSPTAFSRNNANYQQ